MNILITGAYGFTGRNLTEALKSIRDGKDRTHPELAIERIFEYTRTSTPEELLEYAAKADFVFHLAGINRPQDPAEFMAGNRDLLAGMLSALETTGNRCPVMLASSLQASLLGRYAGSEYGLSKLAGETLLRDYAGRTGVRALIYRFPNVFGKWCRPNYNSAVATFCHNKARDLPITVSDPATKLELLYIDDLIDEMLRALAAHENRCEYDGLTPYPVPEGSFCFVPTTYHVTLGEIVALLERFHAQSTTLFLPEIPDGSFAKKLYSTYLSYLPAEHISFPLKMNSDTRGSFTELLKTQNCGQFSVNISKPGITKGQHWHHTKWELFIVVAGRARIEMRRIGSDNTITFDVSGEKIEAVHMLPGYTHNIINLSDTEDLVTLMWANEPFDPNHPDTFYEEV